MNYQKLQKEYEKVYSYFKTTCEPFDLLEWDGESLKVWLNNVVVENYSRNDLKNIFKQQI